MSQFYPQQPPPPKSNGANVVLIVFGVLAIVFLLVCGGIGVLGFVAVRQVSQVIDELDLEVDHNEEYCAKYLEDSLKDEPNLKDRIGELQSVTFDHEVSNDEGESEYWYIAHGSTGTAEINAEEEWYEVTSASMKNEDGTLVALVIGPVPYSDDMGQAVYRIARESPELVAAVGEIDSVEDDNDRTDAETSMDDPTYFYLVIGSESTVSVKSDHPNEDGHVTAASWEDSGKTWHELELPAK